MKEIFYVAIATVATFSLLSFVACLYMVANKPKTMMLYKLCYAESNLGRLTIKEKIIFLLASLFIFVAVWQGALAMLFWMPKSGIAFFGDGMAIVDMLSGMFALIGGMLFINVIIKAVSRYFEIKRLYVREDALMVKAHELERLLDAQIDGSNLEIIKNEFLKKIEDAKDG